jgi:ankyrin repeat protein
MLKRILLVAVVCLAMGAGAVQHAQQPPKKVDFATEVRPIFRQYCLDCHGPKEQKSGLRLDRRKDAMRGGTIAVIGPGNSDGSRLYHKLIGDKFGPQMPPTGALPAAHVATIKRWIDEGAEWPDAVSGDAPPAPLDPDAAALLNATLSGDIATLRQLLARGVNPNLTNASGVTPLMLAVTDLEKATLLIERGADVNARSDDGRTPLLIAAGIPGTVEVSRLLLDRGAKITARAPGLIGETTPLMQSLYSGDEATFKLLVERGASIADGGFGALGLAMRAQCGGCIEMILKALDKSQMTPAMLLTSPPTGPALATPMLLDLGADLNARDQEGRTALMLAAASEALPVDSIAALLQRGADVNAATPTGETALTFAKLRGDTPVTQLLLKAGGIDGKPRPSHTPTYAPAASPRAAVARALPLLQRTDVTFMKKSGCVSCHHNAVAAMTVSLARARGIAVDETIAKSQVKAIGAYVGTWSDRALQGIGIPGDADTVSYILLGLAAEKHAPDAATDAMAYFLKTSQVPDGSWRLLAHRPPIEVDEVQATAMSMRALQAYAPASQRAAYKVTIDRAAGWLAKATPRRAEGRAFHLLGLHWSNAGAASIQKAAKAILAEQRADGGWSQMPTLASDAYATGQALVALLQSGAATASDPAVRKGMQFLLRTQLADGSWYVPSRALPIQPHFESGFPHGKDQFISAAGSNWAAMALTYGVNRGS